jgi:general secretion pathway protein A
VYGINDAGGFIQLTGEVGTGKTTTIRSLLARSPNNADIALIINPRLSPVEFLQAICEELGVEVPTPRSATARCWSTCSIASCCASTPRAGARC